MSRYKTRYYNTSIVPYFLVGQGKRLKLKKKKDKKTKQQKTKKTQDKKHRASFGGCSRTAHVRTGLA
jgi:hypothetical protein